MLVMGAAMVAMMAFRPQGLLPLRLPRFRLAELPPPEAAAPQREALP
jgi:hypothetical protein